MKLNIGELINDNFSQSDVISYVSQELVTITKNLVEDCNQSSWSGVGASINQLGQLASILQKLDEKVNGKKEGTVL